MENVIQIRCIKHIYPDKTEVSLCGLDFIVDKGDRVVILGPNGSGKTTLLSHIFGLLKPVEGTVKVMGMDPSKNFNNIRKQIGVVFQNVDEQIIGPRVIDDIAFTPRNNGLSENEIKELVEDVSKQLGIESILNKIPHYLSGGQKKKVALAGALVTNPEILILDEPFDGLDPKSKMEMIDLLNRLNKEKGITIVITTHDINIVSYIADVIYVICNGQIVSKGNPKEIFEKTELLKESNLEPPILTELFSRLNRSGLNVSIPDNIDEAEKILKDLLDR